MNSLKQTQDISPRTYVPWNLLTRGKSIADICSVPGSNYNRNLAQNSNAITLDLNHDQGQMSAVMISGGRLSAGVKCPATLTNYT